MDCARASDSQLGLSGALRALQSSAGRGDAESQYLLGLMYATGVGTPVSQPDALRWLTQAAQQSHTEAAYALAGLLAYSDGSMQQILEKGKGPNGADLRPPMHIYHLSADDTRAIVAYLRSLSSSPR